MKCIYCNQKEYYVMKLECLHHICINCFNKPKGCLQKCCSGNIVNNKSPKKDDLNSINVHWYDTMYDYDNGII